MNVDRETATGLVYEAHGRIEYGRAEPPVGARTAIGDAWFWLREGRYDLAARQAEVVLVLTGGDVGRARARAEYVEARDWLVAVRAKQPRRAASRKPRGKPAWCSSCGARGWATKPGATITCKACGHVFLPPAVADAGSRLHTG